MGDEWLGLDKAQHLIACMSISIAIGGALAFSSKLRRWRIQIACVTSLTVGAAKEALDELHVWNSHGASAKDAIADVAGAAMGAVVLWSWPRIFGWISTRKELVGDEAV